MLAAVDSITQAVLGAAVGEAVLGKKLGNRALGWGAAFGTLPDLDVLAMPLLDRSAGLWWHRGPSHSLLLMVLASWLLAKPLQRWWARDKVSRLQAGWFVFLAWSTHVLIDCFTVYGTLVFWPFSSYRAGFNQLFIIDPAFTLPMLVALVWLAFLRGKKQLAKRRRLNAWGLGLASAYALLAAGMKEIASRGFDADLARRGIACQRRMEAPTPFNILLWRSVADCGDRFLVGYRSVFEASDAPIRWTVYPKGADALAGIVNPREQRAVRAVQWFSDGWWIARPHAQGAWIGDLRFGEMRVWGAKRGMVDHRLAFSWDIVAGDPHDPLRPLGMKRPDPGDTLRRMVARIFGAHEAWDAQPRLAGVTGHLPDALAVEE